MHEGHRDRLKDSFIKNGYTASGWQEHNLLELLLFYCIPRVDTNETAHRLIGRFGSISGILDASPEALSSVEGIGKNSAVFLKLLPQVFAVYAEGRNPFLSENADLSSVDAEKKFMIPKFFGLSEEAFYIVCLDNKNCVISCDKLFTGSVNVSQVNIRKIVEYALKNSAASLIAAHNHPHGTPAPSYNDVLLTKQLSEILGSLNINLKDHIIVADNLTYSMNEMKDI